MLARTLDWVRYGAAFPAAFADTPAGDRRNGRAGIGCSVGNALELVGATWSGPDARDGSLILAVVTEVANEAGNLHGGVTFAGAVLCAQLTLEAVRPKARVTSAHVVHIAAGTTGDVGATVPHAGRSAQLVLVEGVDASGRLVAQASVTAQT